MSTDDVSLLPTSPRNETNPDCWRTLRWAFKFNTASEIIPIESHQTNEQIFHDKENFQKLVMDKMTKRSTSEEKSVACESYSDAQRQAVERFAGNGGINAAVGNIMCSSVFAEGISSSYSVETSDSFVNVVHETFTINLPEEHPDIEDYLDPVFKRKLDDITDKKAAKELVEKLGGGLYISKATFGGVLKRKKTAERQEQYHNTNKSSAKDARVGGSVDVFADFSAGTSYENNQEQAESASSRYKSRAYTCVGGLQNLSKDYSQWVESIQGNEEIVDFKLASISQLLPLVQRKSMKSEKKGKKPEHFWQMFKATRRTIDDDDDDDDDNNYDAAVNEKWLDEQKLKKAWLDDSITEYAKLQYQKKLETDLKDARNIMVEKLKSIFDEFTEEIQNCACNKKNADNIILKPLRKLRKDIEENQMMSGKGIENVLAKIDEGIEPKISPQTRWRNSAQKHELYFQAHKKINNLKFQCSKLFPEK